MKYSNKPLIIQLLMDVPEADIHERQEFPEPTYGGKRGTPKYDRLEARWRFVDALLTGLENRGKAEEVKP